MKNFILLGTRVLVKQKEIKEQSQGGIILPTTSQTKPLEGTIIAIGERVQELGPFNIRVGRRILFDPFAGVEVTLDEEAFLVMDAEDIILIFK